MAGTNEYTADISSWLGLANAYWDIVTWCGFTPYVGAGIGFATISVNGLKDVNVPHSSVVLRRRQHGHQLRLGAACRSGLRRQPAARDRSQLSLGQSRQRLERRRDAPTDGSSSYSHVAIRDIHTNDVMLGVRYKFNREQPMMYAVK